MKKAFLIISALIALFAFSVIWNKISLRYDWKTAAVRTLMSPFTGNLWAEGFSEERFSKVKVGMFANEVEALLGKPLNVWPAKNGFTWLYSWQDTPTADYDRRWVSFKTSDLHSGKVIDVSHEFFID